MVNVRNLFLKLLVSGSLCCLAQDLPRVEAVVKPFDKLVSVDGQFECGNEGTKWFSERKPSEVGLIASPDSGWQNRAHVHGFDCVAVFQILPKAFEKDAGKLHPWMKFPAWSHISLAKVKLGEVNAVVLSRNKLSDFSFDQIYVACFDADRLIAVRVISLGPSRDVDRAKAAHEFIQMVRKKPEGASQPLGDLPRIDRRVFADKRDTPSTVAAASLRLAGDLTPEEQEHLLKSIHNENELFEAWPTKGDVVARLHWILVYWGLNDPDSPLRKSIGQLHDADNGSYVFEILKATEKRLREKK